MEMHILESQIQHLKDDTCLNAIHSLKILTGLFLAE